MVEGTLDHILYVNDRNGYAVAVIKTYAERGDSRSVTMIGDLAGLEIGSGIRARGRFGIRGSASSSRWRMSSVRPAGVFAIEIPRIRDSGRGTIAGASIAFAMIWGGFGKRAGQLRSLESDQLSPVASRLRGKTHRGCAS